MTAVFIAAVFSCQSKKKFRDETLNTSYWNLKKGERLAEEKCSGCHLTPHPQELEQYTWEYILAYMGLYFGIGSEKRLSFDEGFLQHYRLRVALMAHQKTAGIAGLLSKEDFYTLRNYYLVKSEVDPPPVLPDFETVLFFEGKEFLRSEAAGISLLKYFHPNLYIGDAANSALEIHDLTRQTKNRIKAESPPVALQWVGGQLYITLIGDLLGTAPEVRSASLVRLAKNRLVQIAGQLTRTAGTLLTDLDGDNCMDLLNPGFGAPLNGGIYQIKDLCRPDIKKEELLLRRDGAVAIEPYSLANRPGYLIAFANAQEGLVFLHFQNSKAKFQELLQLPATTGITSMKITDFSGDGLPEILLTGGDNADAGPYNTIKPAMGVRIYTEINGNLQEKYFFHYPGAFNSAVADINRDGRQDFVVVSYFSDLRKTKPDDALLFLNEGNFHFKVLRLPAEGRFSTVEIADTNRDGWPDILLGRAELPYQQRVNNQNQTRLFSANRPALLVLQHKGEISSLLP